jgi:peptide/nickel transport system permease protein
MGQLILRRALQGILLIFLVSVAAFSLTWLLPGDPAYAISGIDATPEQAASVRAKLNLDTPAPKRYVQWLGNAFQGDFGESVSTDRPVAAELKRRLPITASIAIGAFIMAIIIGTVAGVIQGAFAGRLPDKVGLFFVSLGLSIPQFWIATLMITYFGVKWKLFPVLGYVSFADSPGQWLKYAFLPMFTLALFTASEVARQLRTGLVGVLDQDYIRAARARGITGARVIGRHALKNAALPTITIIGVRLGFLLAGSVIVESIFGIPGLGQYAYQAVQNRDVPIIQAVVVISASVVITISVLVDIAYAFLNPKVRVR